ncbi:MAG: phosphoenolpyruvate-utilizing N-terminal domain-containing protein, partial [bacterium]
MSRMNNKIFSGRSLSPGIGIGPASVLPEPRFEMQDVKIIPGEAEAEIKRFYKALEETRQKTHELKEDVTNTLFDQLGELFSVQEFVLEDNFFTSRVENEIKENFLCAESAIINALRELNDEFVERTKGQRLESRTVDFLDVGMRLLDHMGAPVARRQIPSGGVLIARNIAPSIAVSLDNYDIDGLVIDETDRSSHTAVVAQALEIPTVGIFEDEFYENIEAGMQV